MKQTNLDDYTDTIEVDHSDSESNSSERKWRWVPLQSISTINPSKREVSSQPDNLNVTFVPMKSVDDGTGKITERISKEIGEVRRGYTYFREGDVLFAKITPCMENGKCAIAESLQNGIGFGSTEFYIIRPAERVLSEWIHRYLRQERIRIMAKSKFRGAVGQQRVPRGFLESLEIPLPFKNGLPDPDEQRRIISLIEDYFVKIDDIVMLIDEILKGTKIARQSLLKAAFDGAL